MAKKKDNTTSIGFEETIWRAADKLRGNLNAAEYEGVVLGLIFLKYISDKFDAKFAELSQDEYADVEDKDEYEADGVFFVPQDARWSVISLAAHTPEIGKIIDDALLAIERENPKLKGVLPGNYARPELDKRRLGDVVDLFSNIKMLAAGEEKDLLGRVYEYCLQKFASMEGLYPKLYRTYHSRDSAALSGPSLRPLLWFRWYVCAECQVYQESSARP